MSPSVPELKLLRFRRRFPNPHIPEPGATVRTALLNTGVTPVAGQRIAIAVGSRGIMGLPILVRAIADWVREYGAHPFIVPAMGSHGGATPEGQAAVLERYGISESLLEIPVISSLRVRELPCGDSPVPVYFSEDAWAADATILLNRIKPHTDFHGIYESGLMKMMAVGLGKHAQALALHRLGARGLRDVMPIVSRQILQYGNVLLGVGVLENAYHCIAKIFALPAQRIPEAEPSFLDEARRIMARLPVTDLDILMLDQMGKDISGAGMDTNVIGRLRIAGEPDPEEPRIRQVIVTNLTPASHGNACGIGLADVVTRELAAKIDWPATNENIVTSGFFLRGFLPLVADTPEQAYAWSWRACGEPPAAEVRFIRVLDTLHLDELLVSPAVARELANRDDCEFVGDFGDKATQAHGNPGE